MRSQLWFAARAVEPVASADQALESRLLRSGAIATNFLVDSGRACTLYLR